MNAARGAAWALLGLLGSLACRAHPCAGVDRQLTAARRAAWAPAIEAHLNRQMDPVVPRPITIAPDQVLQLFRVGRWHIVEVNTLVTDEPYLVYPSAPDRAQGYPSYFAGAATEDDGPNLHAWLRRDAAGMPARLRNCLVRFLIHGEGRAQ